MATAATAAVPPVSSSSSGDDDETELMHRLQAQFGDMDLTQLLSGEGAGTRTARGEDGTGTNDDASVESSLAEPSPEELQAWQDAQFQKGQAELEEKRHNETKSAVQRRRAELRNKMQQQQQQPQEYVDDEEEGDDDWEQIAALPDLQGQSSVFFPTSDAQGNEILGVHPLLQQLAEGDSEILGTSWKRMYSSAESDGLSFFHLLETLRGYAGPTVLLIGAVPAASKTSNTTSGSSSSSNNKKTTIGFFTTSPWMESTSFTGTADCFLFAMDEDDEKLHFFRPRTLKSNTNRKEPNYMYCHPSTLNVTSGRRQNNNKGATMTDGLVHGLGVGGTSLQPRLHLTETLEDCRAMEYCRLFEGGDLLLGQGKDSLNYFDVDCLEVWAVGGEEWIADSMAQRKAQRDVAEATLVKARKVDKQQFLRDFHLLAAPSGLFGHVHHATDRCDV